jgi:hypothetical protein
MKLLRVLAGLFLIGLLSLAAISFSARAQTAVAGCPDSSEPSDKSVVTICFTSPTEGASLTGNVTVAVATNLTSESADIQRMVFTLNGVYLLTTYTSPFVFTLPTEKWADGSYTIQASTVMRDGDTPAQASITVTFSNGNATAPVNTNQFTPSTGNPPADGAPFIVAAAGDGASGEDTASKVVKTILSLHPNLFLYLGDVYESGSVAEFYNWYGTNSSNFSALRAITDPTIGNHEYTNGVNGAGYFDYWDNIPSYYSFDANGWHFISLNANVTKVFGAKPDTPEYNWLAHDLDANAKTCTIAFYHEPLFNIGAEGPTVAMAPIWALLANYKVPIVLNGHDHDYQRWVPLDGNGEPSASGITEFVAGGAGHGLQDFVKTDIRVAYSNDMNPTAFGVLLLELSSTGADFSYHSSNGSILDSGFIPCVSGQVSTFTASDPTPVLTATAILADASTSTLSASPTAAGTDTPIPSATEDIIARLLGSTLTPAVAPISPPAHKTSAILGITTFAGIVILLTIAGIVMMIRRRG